MRFLLPALLVVAVVGCGSDPDSRPTTVATLHQPALPVTTPISVEEVRGEQLEAAIANHKDKVVVVDLWATWCETCVKKFPHFASMQKKYADKGLVCVSVAMEKLTASNYSKDRVLDYLKKQDAAFPNYIVAEPEKDEVPLTRLFGDGYRLIPLMVIFDKAGRRIWSSDGDGPAPTDAQLDKMVEDLLAK